MKSKRFSVGRPTCGLAVLAGFTLMAVAQPPNRAIYKHVDKSGAVAYSDSPASSPLGESAAGESEEHELGVLTVISSPSSSADSGDDSAQPDPSDLRLGYSALKIVSPTADTLRSNNGDVTVTVLLEPELNVARGDRLRVLLDSNVRQQWSDSRQSVTLTNVNRGEHQLRVEVIDSAGRVMVRSATHRFVLQRYSAITGRNAGS